MVIFGPHFFIYQNFLQNMGKSSKSRKERRAEERLTKKASFKSAAGSTNIATGVATEIAEAPKIVKLGFKVPTPIVEPEIPKAPPIVIPEVVHGKLEGYVLDTAFTQNGNIKYTKVLVDNNGWDIILCKEPAVVMKPGALIRFTPGEYQGRMTVTQPIVVDENTPLVRFFEYCIKMGKDYIEEVSLGKLAKGYMSTNHVGVSDEDKFKNFLAGQNILSIVGLLEGNRFIITK